jgi:FAD:protein FMN transferase
MQEKTMAAGFPVLSRRRMLAIFAGVSVAARVRTGSAAGAPALHRWRGSVLGAEASITLAHGDANVAARVLDQCVEELRRLEGILTLYDPGSALSVLNRRGMLERPPAELVAVLRESIAYGELSDGAFDVTVQPLWRLYADHFAAPAADPAGPSAERVEAARRLADYRAIEVKDDRIRLTRAGMAVTLNGIAQGWITDRVADLLRARGFNHVLLDLGEERALGGRIDGRPWRVGIADPRSPERVIEVVDLRDRAMATSGGYGFLFDPAGRFSHILDPSSGRSAAVWASVSVVAESATRADALSTALSVAPRTAGPGILAAAGDCSALCVGWDGAIVTL